MTNPVSYTPSQSLVFSNAFQTMLENTPDFVFVKEANLRYVTASLPFLNLVGLTHASQIVGKTDFELFRDESLAQRYVSDDQTLLSGGKDLVNYIEPLGEADGTALYGSTSKYILSDPGGQTIGLLGVTRDITREYISRQHYQQELKYLFKLPPDTFAAVFIDIDTWRIINQRRQLVNGNTMHPCHTVGQLLDAALASIQDPDSEAAQFYRNFTPDALRAIYESGQREVSFEYRREMVNGSHLWIHNDIRYLTDPETGHLCVMLIARDVDSEHREAQDLEKAATLDRLTQVLNRETTEKRIRQALADFPHSTHALFMVDIDNFKSLNDTRGHLAGDAFLTQFAKELCTCFRRDDIVGRVGGDEFFTLMQTIPNVSAAQSKAELMLEVIRRLCADYAPLQLSGSIGISLYPTDGKTLEELYAKADAALYQAKRAGKNQFVFATPPETL